MTKCLLSWSPACLHLCLFQIPFEMKIGISKYRRKYGDIAFFVSQIADTLCEKKWKMARLSKIHPSNSPCAGLSLRYKISPQSILRYVKSIIELDTLKWLYLYSIHVWDLHSSIHFILHMHKVLNFFFLQIWKIVCKSTEYFIL